MTKKIEALPLRGQTAVWILTVLIFTSLFVGCSLTPGSKPPDSQIFGAITELPTPPVEIQFILELPQPLSDGDQVFLEILDEVTGLPYNKQNHSLSRIDNQRFSTTLSIPAGSVIKYRYIKTGQTITPEAKQGGEPVRYRLFYAGGNEKVTDLLQAWHGDSINSDTGTLIGTIREQTTNLPIPDILVSAGGQLTFADANGKFALDGLSPGIHNVLFYAIDGQYKTYQQGASISTGLTTPAEVNLVPMSPVNITFNITAPNDAIGAPIYLAGNLAQLGNTFTDLTGSMSIKPKRMPMLTMKDDGTYTISLQLYAESDLRFKFTLGDGYWNSEKQPDGKFVIRQLIVPNQDIAINLDIASWRTPGIEPVTFQIAIPFETAPQDEKFIQFKTTDWTESIPLWPLGNGNYLYILFSPLSASSPIMYQFCRNEECQNARNATAVMTEAQVVPSTTPQTVTATLDTWENWQPYDQTYDTGSAFVPGKSSNYSTIIELTPEMNPSWMDFASAGFSRIAEISGKTVVFTPQWFVNSESPILHPKIGATPFHYELTAMLNTSQTLGLERGLFPQMGPGNLIESYWGSGPYSEAWWNSWFDSYQQFILNYAKIAEQTGTEQLILGGKSVLPAFSGGIYLDGTESDVPDASEGQWLALIADIRAEYNGDLIWGTNAHQDMDPLPNFIDKFDGIYISIDSPLAAGNSASFEEIAEGFTSVIDSLIFEIHRSTLKPITLALAYPAIDGAAQGCVLFGSHCYTDGLFLADEIASYPTDLEEQALIYEAILPVIASRDWITGLSIRGYEPTVISQDGTSSIAGKPAMDVIRYWYSGFFTD